MFYLFLGLAAISLKNEHGPESMREITVRINCHKIKLLPGDAARAGGWLDFVQHALEVFRIP